MLKEICFDGISSYNKQAFDITGCLTESIQNTVFYIGTQNHVLIFVELKLQMNFILLIDICVVDSEVYLKILNTSCERKTGKL